jgi:hypothetical protein
VTGQSRAVMADWLALHGLTVAECRALLVPADPQVARRVPDPAYAGPPPWPAVIAALAEALPMGAAVMDQIRTGVRIDLAPDPVRFPRPFTLHDDGQGLPFVSCPLKGRMSDLIVMAHEAGHVCQIVASGRTDLPPVLRETAACLAEHLVARVLGGALPRLAEARDARLRDRSNPILARALGDMDTPYDNVWNYPPARTLARRAAAGLPDAMLWQIFAGELTVTGLAALTAT